MTSVDMTGNNDRSRINGTKRLLIVHRYYWPDNVACASIMRWVAVNFAREGFLVDVLSSFPSYRYMDDSNLETIQQKEIVDDVKIIRLKLPPETGKPFLRVFNALRLGTAILFYSIKNRYDAIIVTSIPPVLGGVWGAIAAKIIRSKFLYYCMDIHPEVGRVSGDFSNRLLYKTLLNIDIWTCSVAAPVLVHSVDMRDALLSRPGMSGSKIEILNNFSLPSESLSNVEMVDLKSANNNLTVIYTGNIGRFQGLEDVIDAMGLISDRKDIMLVIMGDGVAKKELIDRVHENGSNVFFFGYMSIDVAKDAIRQADIGLVTLVEEMYKYAYPSKTMAYLEQGRPIIAAIEEESELAINLKIRDYGFSVTQGDSSGMARLLLKLADDKTWKEHMNTNALKVFQSDYDPEVVLERWIRVLRTGRTVL